MISKTIEFCGGEHVGHGIDLANTGDIDICSHGT